MKGRGMATTGELIRTLGHKGGVILDVGLGLGDSACVAMNELKPKRLVSVDPFLNQPWEEYPDDYNVSQEQLDERRISVVARILKHGESLGVAVDCIRKTAQEFIASTQDRFDFIFLDANHSYESVKEDLSGLWPLLKDDRVIMCHDYCSVLAYYGVIEAVDEFIESEPNAIRLQVSSEKHPVIAIRKVAA